MAGWFITPPTSWLQKTDVAFLRVRATHLCDTQSLCDCHHTMLLSRRCWRKNPLVSDSFAIVLFSTFLIVVAIYYISPPASPNAEEDQNVANHRSHLRQVLEIDQDDERELRLQIDAYDDQ